MNGYVYFIQADGGNEAIKIGWSNRPRNRLVEIRAASPIPVLMRGCVEGNLCGEKWLHAYLGVWRLHCEWFSPSPEVLEAMRASLAGELPLVLVPNHKNPKGWERTKFLIPPKLEVWRHDNRVSQ